VPAYSIRIQTDRRNLAAVLNADNVGAITRGHVALHIEVLIGLPFEGRFFNGICPARVVGADNREPAISMVHMLNRGFIFDFLFLLLRRQYPARPVGIYGFSRYSKAMETPHNEYWRNA
jgi:hypothetical protein